MHRIQKQLLILFLAASSAAFAQNGRMEGNVVTSAGEPIRGAELRLMPFWGAQAVGEGYSAFSDERGHFVFEDIEPFPGLGLTARKAGFQGFRYGAPGPRDPIVLIPITAGESRTDIVVTMEQQGIITGRVVDAAGDPVPKAVTWAVRVAAGMGGVVAAGGTAQTDDRGEFRLTGLAPGHYHVVSQIAAAPDADGLIPLVTYYPNATQRESAAPIEIAEGQQTTGLEIQIQRGRGYAIRGTLTGATASSLLAIEAVPASGVTLSPLSGGGGTAQLKSDGTFEITPVVPGEYVLRVVAITGSPLNHTAKVTVISSDINGVVMEEPPTYTISGKVTVEDGTLEDLTEAAATLGAGRGGPGRGGPGRAGAAPGGAGRGASAPRGLRLTLNPNEANSSIAAANAAIGDDGTFSFQNVSSASYHFSRPDIPQTYVKAIHWNGQDITNLPLEIHGNGQLEIVFGRGAVRITGNVRDPDGKAVQGAFVVLWPEQPIPAIIYEASRGATTDINGAYAMPAIAPGLYRAAGFPGIGGNAALQRRFLEQFNDLATKVEIQEDMPIVLDPVVITAEQIQEAQEKLQ